MTTDYYLEMLQQAALLNTVAVTGLMTSGDSNTCLRVFNDSLSLMERVSGCPLLKKTVSEVPCVWKSFTLPEMKDDGFFVCPQALLFTVPHKPTISEVEVSFYSALVMYNMALTYHQEGLQGQQEGLLQNALQLYEHCHQILGTILCPPGNDVDRLHVATRNNQAQIYHLHHQYGKSYALLHEIGKFFPALFLHGTTPNDDHSVNVFHGRNMIKEISMNALLVTGGSSPPVAPSA